MRTCIVWTIFGLLMISPAMGQRREERLPARQSQGSVDLSRGGGSTRGGLARTTPRMERGSQSTVQRQGLGSSRARFPSRSGEGYVGGSMGSVPIQAYIPNYRFHRSSWNQSYRYFELLMHHYDHRWAVESLWRYAQGDSALTPETVGMALRDSSAASSELVSETAVLKQLILNYQQGGMPKDQFEDQVEDRIDEIRSLAKKIRKDDFLDYIDRRRKVDSDKFEAVSSIEGLLELTESLEGHAARIHGGISSYARAESTRVISVQELEKPSLDTLSKNVDRLAKAIQKSSERL